MKLFFREYYSMFGILGFLLIVFTAVLLVYVSVKDHIRTKKQNKQWEEELNAPLQLPDVDSVYATVAAKDVVMEKGYFPTSPRLTHRLNYIVSFITEDNIKVDYSVPQDLFEMIYIGQKGILATIENEFFDFGQGEDMEG